MTVKCRDRPFGVSDLEVNAARRYGTGGDLILGERVRCCIRDCTEWLPRWRPGPLNDDHFCPEHGISVAKSPTFVFRDPYQNIIVGHDLLRQVKKVEKHRLGRESSEDALTWNLFVGISQLNALAATFRVLTGLEVDVEPELYLWGTRINGPQIAVWPRLSEIRSRLEPKLRISTEPDVILRIPGQAIVIIEAKFGSVNGTLGRKKNHADVVNNFLRRYPCRGGTPDPVNREWISRQEPTAVLEQLVRNVVYVHWLANGEQPFVANLVLENRKSASESFLQHLAPEGSCSYHVATWEQIAAMPVLQRSECRPLRQYLANKSLNLRKALIETRP